MAPRSLQSLILALVLAAFTFRLATIWPQLPERIAAQFDFAGNPTRWSSKTELAVISGFLAVVFVASFVGVGWLERVPNRYINLPGKDYWLVPERRAETLRWVVQWTRWFLIAMLAFVGWVVTEAAAANTLQAPRFVLPIWSLAAVAVLVAALIGGLYWRLRPPR